MQGHRPAAEPIHSCRRTPESHARTMLELPGSADQLQPAGPHTRNTDEALPKQEASGGAQAPLPSHGVCSATAPAAPAAPRHSPRCRTQRPAQLPARQQQAACRSRHSGRRWWGQSPACWPHRAGTEPSSALTGGKQRRRRHFSGP